MTGHAAFAVPGDLQTRTGGYLYDRRVIEGLRKMGWTVDHVALPQGFPDPSEPQMAEAIHQLRALPPDRPVIIDGLAFGALDPDRVSEIEAPIVALVHHPLARESGLDPARRDRLHTSERRNLTHAAHVIVPSPYVAHILTADYAVPQDRITVAIPGVDRATGPARPASPPVILSVGVQLPRKGHDVLLRALARLSDLDWRAVIVGAPLDPDHAAFLQDLTRELGLTDRVEWTGQLGKDAVAERYRTASLFALATRYEGYGIVFNEALAHGLPILSCDAGAVSGTVPPEAGRLVPPDDPVAFADALRVLLTD